MSLQLEKKVVDFAGRPYVICCNMAALDELQELHGGSMDAVFQSPVNFVTAELFLIMLNRTRRRCGEEPLTREELGEEYNYAMLEDLDIFGMFLRAMNATVARKTLQEDAAAENTEKN